MKYMSKGALNMSIGGRRNSASSATNPSICWNIQKLRGWLFALTHGQADRAAAGAAIRAFANRDGCKPW
jgi:hypothetical protein